MPALNWLLRSVQDQVLEGRAVCPRSLQVDLFATCRYCRKLAGFVDRQPEVLFPASLALAALVAHPWVLARNFEEGELVGGCRGLAVAHGHSGVIPNHGILSTLKKERRTHTRTCRLDIFMNSFITSLPFPLQF